ncbi:MAG: acetoacetate--CoA ligase [Solirubrobacteraceae bacterium]|nr:acetoacetate--CoA ligase [Solirubrobacteraceae bacterium]
MREGDVLWSPPADALERTRMGRFLTTVNAERGLDLEDYDDLHRWSVTDLEGFWESVARFFDVRFHAPYERVLAERRMPGAVWFPGAKLNYVEHLLGTDEDTDTVAIVARSQTRDDIELTFGELRERVARCRAGLQRLGVQPGDRVVGYLPNIPETLIAFAATASLGAVWASCAPEFGVRSVVDRFGQIEPKVLLAVAGYNYGEKWIDRRREVAEIRASIPSVEHVVHVPYGEPVIEDAVGWDDLLAEDGPLAFDPVPFDHPIFVLFSSGTTGLPKAIIHGHGGILLEHCKNLGLAWDLNPGDRLLWFSTTAWMMWNALVSVLLTRASIVMIDGNPGYPDMGMQWRLAQELEATHMGVAPAFMLACRKAGVQPREYDLGRLRMLLTAGSPLPLDGYEWVYEQLGPDIILNNGSGGTDICSGMVGGSPLQKVYAGEIAGRHLAVAADAYDENGNPVVGELGELVITEPLPSMPVGFWGDEDGSRYRAAYFDVYPGVWRHGDWIRFTERGSCVVTGRSDATLNRGGVRLGTSELYAVVEENDEVLDSLIVHLEDPGGGMGELILFVVLREGHELTDELRARIARSLKDSLSPRHVPDTIVAVPHIPRTMTGKKLEVPVKRILQGTPPEKVASRDALAEPDALDAFVEFANSR